MTVLSGMDASGAEGRPSWMDDSMERLEKELVKQYGPEKKERLLRGMRQVADFWRESDGGSEAFEKFVSENFAGDETTLQAIFERSERIFEHINGAMHDVGIELRRQSDLDLGPVLPVDRVLAAWDPGAHVTDDLALVEIVRVSVQKSGHQLLLQEAD